MMEYSYTDNRVRELFAEFQRFKTYKDKIIFYDRSFGIVLDEFPQFNARLDIFFQMEASNFLIEIFERERKNSLNLEKVISTEEGVFSFNVAPINSYAEVYNDYIVTKFLEIDLSFKSVIKELRLQESAEPGYLLQRQSEARQLIQTIEQKLNNFIDTSIRGKFMTVFYEGYSDQVTNNLKTFSKRKKIIELYLYSQGILYARYMDAISSHPLKGKSITDRVQLLKDSGVLDFLRQKYPATTGLHEKQKLMGIISQILGVNKESLAGLVD